MRYLMEKFRLAVTYCTDLILVKSRVEVEHSFTCVSTCIKAYYRVYLLPGVRTHTGILAHGIYEMIYKACQIAIRFPQECKVQKQNVLCMKEKYNFFFLE